uniref:RING-type domain-containing protein n=1 Tax=Panagrolaimus sp. ES5 TaxID=591445 RepID=A0AC34GTS9_9BILA
MTIQSPNNKCYPNVKKLNNEKQIGISVEALECKICFDLFEKIPGLLKCGHSFCYKCIQLIRDQAISKNIHSVQCPLCTKTVYLTGPIIPNYAFDEVLQYASLCSKKNKNVIVQSNEMCYY